MYVYDLKFDNKIQFKLETENLDKAHERVISQMESNNHSLCVIICPTGLLRRVRKTGENHWKHNGYSFD